jgi:hypothetical protein
MHPAHKHFKSRESQMKDTMLISTRWMLSKSSAAGFPTPYGVEFAAYTPIGFL